MGKKQKESNVSDAIRLELAKRGCKVFRSQVGLFYKKVLNIGINYPIFLFFSVFSLIIRFILTKKSVVAPCMVIPPIPQEVALSYP